MVYLCAGCSAPVFSGRVKALATPLWPSTCPRCGVLNAPSWWSGLVGIVAVCALMGALWLAFSTGSWIPFVAGLAVFCAVLWVQHRYMPLARISRREVALHRLFGLAAVVAIALWSAYLALFDHV